MKLWLATDWIILDSQLPLSIFAKKCKANKFEIRRQRKGFPTLSIGMPLVNFRLCHTKGPDQIVSHFLVLNKLT